MFRYNRNFKKIPDDTEKVAKAIVDAAFKVHTIMGPGLAETAYEETLSVELRSRGLNVKTQVVIPLSYIDYTLRSNYRMDMLVEDCVIVEIKSVKELHPSYPAQLLKYLERTGIRLGLLINFGDIKLKNNIHRFVK